MGHKFSFCEGCETVLSCDNCLKLMNGVQEIKHGKWVFDKTEHRFLCSECHWHDNNKYYFNGVKPVYAKNNGFVHCPNCGAKMEDE